jgi:hypothetical protein
VGPGPGRLWLPLRRWKLLLAGALAFGALAWYTGERFGRPLYEAEGSVLYRPPSAPGELTNAFNPPNAPSVSTMVKTRANLQALHDEFQLSSPVELLDQQLKVNQPYGGDVITVTLDWPDAKAGVALVNRLLEMHRDQVAGLRRDSVEKFSAKLDEEYSQSSDALAAAREAPDRARGSTDVHDARREQEEASKDVQAAEVAAEAAGRRLDGLRARLKKLDVYVAAAKAGGEPPPPDVADEDVGSAYRIRRQALTDAMQEQEAKRSAAQQQADAKRRECKELEPLVLKNILPKADLDKARDELNGFALAAADAEKAVQRRKADLETLPLQQAQAQRVKAAEQANEARDERAAWEAKVAAGRKRVQELDDVLAAQAPLEKRLDEAGATHKHLAEQRAILDRFRRLDPQELVVVSPAAAKDAPVSSNRPKIWAAAFGAPMLLLLGFMYVQERFRAHKTPQARAAQLGLPVLARPLRRGALAGREGAQAESRRLAWRLRERISRAGPVLLFNALDDGRHDEELLKHLSRYLAMQGEKVLLLDARHRRPPAALRRAARRPARFGPGRRRGTAPAGRRPGWSSC